jgi:uracil-DNA glycosylase family 4
MAEKIDNIFNEVKNCDICLTINGYKKFPFGSHGKTNSKYMLVSEAPGKKSLSYGKYWMGAGGKILRASLNNFNEELENIFYLTDIVKCCPNGNEKNRNPDETEIINCSPYLKREIEVLKPYLIVSFGKSSSEYLLGRDITMKDSHGKIYDYNDLTKVLIMYHPSGIDRHMKRDIYIKQLKDLFKNIIENKIDDIKTIFSNSKANEIIKELEEKEIKPNKEINISPNSKVISFILPGEGNKITDIDISKNQLRVTSEFKRHFPDSNSTLKFVHHNDSYSIKFTHRGRRSHILKLETTLMKSLNINSSNSVKIKKISSNTYQIEKIE